jgi:hypothetical protein
MMTSQTRLEESYAVGLISSARRPRFIVGTRGHSATRWKVEGSIPVGVIGIFH